MDRFSRDAGNKDVDVVIIGMPARWVRTVAEQVERQPAEMERYVKLQDVSGDLTAIAAV